MSYLGIALQSKEAKEAIGHGLITWLTTGNFSHGIDAMFALGEKNGAVAQARLGLFLDILRAALK
jgi:hypothetical protein